MTFTLEVIPQPKTPEELRLRVEEVRAAEANSCPYSVTHPLTDLLPASKIGQRRRRR